MERWHQNPAFMPVTEDLIYWGLVSKTQYQGVTAPDHSHTSPLDTQLRACSYEFAVARGISIGHWRSVILKNKHIVLCVVFFDVLSELFSICLYGNHSY